MPKRTTRTTRKKVSVSFGKKKRNSSSLFWILILFVFLPLLLWAVYQNTQLRSKASTNFSSANNLFNKAITFNNNGFNDSYASGKSVTKLSQFPYTLEAWIKPPSLSEMAKGVGYQILTNTRESTYQYGFIWQLSITRNDLGIVPILMINFADQGDSNWDIIGTYSTKYLTPNSWNHVAFSGKIITGGLCNTILYINGKEAVSTGFYHGNNCAMSSHNPNELLLGKNRYPYPLYSFYAGLVDDIRFSNISRYSSEFTPTSEEFTEDENTILLYHFNEYTNDTIAHDSSNNKLDLSLSGSHVFFNGGYPPTPTPIPTPTPSPKPRPSPTQTPTPTPTPEPTPPPPQPNRTFRVETLLQNADGKQVPFPLVNARTIVRFTNANGNPQKPLICYQGNNDGQCPVAKYCMSNGSMTLPIKPGGLPCTGAAPGWYSTQWDKTVNVSGKTYELISPTNCDDSICTQEEKILISGKQLHQGIYRQLP